MRSGFLAETFHAEIGDRHSPLEAVDFHNLIRSVAWHPFAGGYLRLAARQYRAPLLTAKFPVPKLQAIGRPMGITCLHDEEEARKILEVPQTPESKGIISTLRYVKMVEGWRGLFRGLGPTLLRLTLQETTAAVTLPKMRKKIEYFIPPTPPGTPDSKLRISARSFLRASATVFMKDFLFYPLQVISSRDLVFESLQWISSMDILRLSIRHDGWKSLFAGCAPFLAARLLEETIEEVFKELLEEKKTEAEKLALYVLEPIFPLCFYPLTHVLYRYSDINRCVSKLPGLCNSNYRICFPGSLKFE